MTSDSPSHLRALKQRLVQNPLHGADGTPVAPAAHRHGQGPRALEQAQVEPAPAVAPVAVNAARRGGHPAGERGQRERASGAARGTHTSNK